MKNAEGLYLRTAKCKRCGRVVDAHELELTGCCIDCWRRESTTNKAKRPPEGFRICSRFRCPHFRDRRCCADCNRRVVCNEACMNDPSRCRLEEK